MTLETRYDGTQFPSSVDDANSVLSQAINGLRAEAELIRESVEADEQISVVLAYAHESRLEALENLLDCYMLAKWRDHPVEAKPEAAQ